MKNCVTYAQALARFTACDDERTHITPSWEKLPFFENGAALKIAHILDERAKNGEIILPAPHDYLNAFTLTPFEKVKVVILGQDPYPTSGDAHGLAFSYAGIKRLPASLRNILKECADDLGEAVDLSNLKIGNLSRWAAQGVLLLNTALSVSEGQAGSHLKIGWQPLIDDVIQILNAHHQHIVFILWGAKAQHYGALINTRHHTVLCAPHPSPLSAYQGFWGSKPFSKTNAALVKNNQTSINWL